MGGMISEEARAWIGKEFETKTFLVSRTDIRKFAVAIGEDNPIHHDPEVARQRGYRDIVAPPNIFVALAFHAAMLVDRSQLGPDGVSSDEVPPIPIKRIMAGETDAQYFGDICAGDEITVSRKIVDLYEKEGQSGPMVFQVQERRYTNQQGELMILEKFTRIFR